MIKALAYKKSMYAPKVTRYAKPYSNATLTTLRKLAARVAKRVPIAHSTTQSEREQQ